MEEGVSPFELERLCYHSDCPNLVPNLAGNVRKRGSSLETHNVNDSAKLRKIDSSQWINSSLTFHSNVEHNIVALTSTLTDQQKESLKADISILGGTILDEWSDTCTHLVMQNVTVTMKVLQSLCHAIPIVTPDYFKALISSNQLPYQLPNVGSFQPPIITQSNHTNISLQANVDRKRLFAGQTFVFTHHRHMNQYKMIIESSMGKCISLDKEQMQPNNLLEPGVIFIQKSTVLQQQRKNQAMNNLNNYLTSKQLRMIPDTEISLAILYASVEKFCNPKYQLKDNLQSNLPNSSYTCLTNIQCLSSTLRYLNNEDKNSLAEASPILKKLIAQISEPSIPSLNEAEGSEPLLPSASTILYPRENVQIGWGNLKKWNVGAGMINLGNTCYLNATLQALFHVPSFATWLLSDIEHRNRCAITNGPQNDCIICRMSNVLQSSQSSMHPIAPFQIYSVLSQISPRLINGRQEDAHEFLKCVLESMENCYLTRFETNKDFEQYTKETTPINQIFGGYLRTSVKCLSCESESVTFQHFKNLLLDIREVNTIDDALTNHFAPEQLQDGDYTCESCKKEVDATKQFSLERPPVVLEIQLKRFSAMNEKIDKHIQVPQQIDVTQHLTKNVKSGKLKYRLVSLITHLGAIPQQGHYTATCSVQNGSYYQFNDAVVSSMSAADVTHTKPYIVFYELMGEHQLKHNVESSSQIVPSILLADNTPDNDRVVSVATSMMSIESSHFVSSMETSPENSEWADIFNNPNYMKHNYDASQNEDEVHNEDNVHKFKLPKNVPANISAVKNNNRYLHKKTERNKPGKHRLRVGIQQKLYTGFVHEVLNGVTMLRTATDNKKIKPKIRKKVLKRNKKHLDADEELFTIVRGLASFIKKSDIATDLCLQIERDVRVVSALSIEASYMIYLYYTTLFNDNPDMDLEDDDEPNFRKIFACLKNNGHKRKANITRNIHKNYFEIRKSHGITNFYDGSHKTNLINIAADRYKVNLHNSVCDHMYQRIRNFLNVACPDIPSYHTLDVLFNSASEFEADERLLDALNEHLNFDGDFLHLSKQWWTFLPLLYRLQQWRYKRNIRNFKIFPILRNRRHHVHYDGQALQQLLNNFKVVDWNYKNFNEGLEWRKYFKIYEVESNSNRNDDTFGHKFFNSISTNGVSVSINMKRKVVQTSEPHRIANIRQLYESGEIDTVKGLDPGERLVFGGVSREVETSQETSIRYNSNSFRYDAGEFIATSKYRSITNELFTEIQNERNLIPDKASSMADPVAFVSFQLKHFQRLNELLLMKKIARLEFQRYIGRRRAIDTIARKIAGGNKSKKKTIIFVGTTETNPAIKGYVRTPKQQMIRAITNYAYVLKVPEFRSTMLCSTCYQPATTSTSPHRWQHCGKCAIIWNRDVNAGRNILYVGIQTLLDRPINRGFSRAFSFEKNATGYRFSNPLRKEKPWTKKCSRIYRKNIKITAGRFL